MAMTTGVEIQTASRETLALVPAHPEGNHATPADGEMLAEALGLAPSTRRAYALKRRERTVEWRTQSNL